MKLNEYQELSKRTMPDYLTWEDKRLAISNYSMGLAGESGEVIDILKKAVHHGHMLDVAEVKTELGDVLHYAAGLATMIGANLEDIAAGNIDKLLERFPNGFTAEDSINRIDTK